jgi:predicted nucleic acid-binding Zn ribbon protein
MWSEDLVSRADTVVVCKRCGTQMEKQLSAPADFIGKGEGFYKSANNYRNDRY